MSAPGLPIPPTPGAPPPGAMRPGGAPPPGPGGGSPMGAPMGGTGPVTAPRPMMGNAAQSLTLVHTGLEAFQKALSGLPMGSELQTAVMKAVIEINKRLDNQQGDKPSQLQALAGMSRDLSANPQAAAMQKMMAPPGGAGGAPPPAPAG